jgi:tetratricopeptide (TPR) repeat protein
METLCRKCGSQSESNARFCPTCGRRLVAIGKGQYAGAIGLAVVIGWAGWGLQDGIQASRPRPKSHPVTQARSTESSLKESPQLVAMREDVRKFPDDLQKLKMFAGMLGDQLRSKPDAPSGLVFEAIEVFGRILEKEPRDPLALVLMADLSFDQKAFTKALDFYNRYLEVAPDDLGARARYASTLTFLGRYDDSATELEKVLKIEPNNFPAKAYLAITFAQKGDVQRAKLIGAEALALAPSEEARARFSSFVGSLDSASSNVDVVGTPTENKGASSLRGSQGFITALRANPVAGPKFVRLSEVDSSTITLFFKEFPMNKMPPFAKQKFFQGLKRALAENGLDSVKKIEFVDVDSGQGLDVFDVVGE